MHWLRNPGTTMAILAVVVLVAAASLGLPLIWVLLVSFALVVARGDDGERHLRAAPAVHRHPDARRSSRRSRSGCRTAVATRGIWRSTSSAPAPPPQAVEDVIQEFHLDEPMYTPLPAVVERRRSAAISAARRSRARRSRRRSPTPPGHPAADALRPAPRPGHRRPGRGLRGVPGEPAAATGSPARRAFAVLSIPNFVLAILLVLFLALGGFRSCPATSRRSSSSAVRYEAVR